MDHTKPLLFLDHCSRPSGERSPADLLCFWRFYVSLGIMRIGNELLTTGQAAELLGCSRQHVVDLCDEGKLDHQSTGKHRRVRQQDIEAYLQRLSARPRREALRSLWLNRAVAGKIARDPEGVLAKARQNLRRFRRIHARGTALPWLDEWEHILDEGPDAVMRTLVSETPHATDLRQNSPFPGVLSERERRDVLEAFSRYWERRAA